MFTLGNKEAIVNSNAKFTAAVTDTTKLNIKGFGTFERANLVSAVCQRYKAPRVGVLGFNAPAGSALSLTSGQVNVPVTFSIKIKSTRLSSEWANQYIINSRPLVFEILVNQADTSAQVAAKMTEAFDAYIAKFGKADNGLPFTYAADVSEAGYLTLTMKDNFLFFQKVITFKTDRIATPIIVTGNYYKSIGVMSDITGTDATVTSTAMLKVGDTVLFTAANAVPTGVVAATTTVASITSGTVFVVSAATGIVDGQEVWLLQQQDEGVFTGKYLEENVRMSLPDTSDSYSISPDEKPLISGTYAMITFTMNDNNGGIGATASTGFAKHAFLGTTRGEVGGSRQFKFTFYVLEGSDAMTLGSASGGFADTVGEWLDASSLSNGTTLKLLLGNGNTAANVDAWRA